MREERDHLEHLRQDGRDFLLATARQEGDDFPVVQVVATSELLGLLTLVQVLADSIEKRMPHVVHLHTSVGVVFLLKRQDDHHLVHIFLDLLDAVFLPSPDLGRDVIANLDTIFLGELGNAEVESGIVHQHQHIRFIKENVGFADADVAQDGIEIQEDLPETHKGQVAIVFHQVAAGSLHQVATPTAEIGFGVTLPEGLHQVGGVKVTGRLAGYYIVFHLDGVLLNNGETGYASRRFTMSETVLLSALPAKALVAIPITLPISFIPAKPLSVIICLRVASISSSDIIWGR